MMITPREFGHHTGLWVTARCVRGLEWVLAAEVTDRLGVGVGDVRLSERQVSFAVPELRSELLDLRTADDLLLDVDELHGIDHTRAALAELSEQLGRVDLDGALVRLEDVRALPAKPGFDVVASLLGHRNYNRFAVEDAAGRVVEDALGARYVSRNPSGEHGFTDGHSSTGAHGPAGDAADTDFTVRLALSGETVQVALRLPRRPLHRRAWKLDTGPGTLHPPLAAALARIGGGFDGGSFDGGGFDNAAAAVIDPFCGDGTIAIETAIAYPDATVLAADLDAGRLSNARANAARAGLAERIRFVETDAGRPAWSADRFELLVTNPPWNRAVGAAGALADSLDPFWRRVPDALGPGGRVCTVADAEADLPARLRRDGYSIALAQTIRLAGRVSQVVLAAPPDAPEVRLSAGLSRWRERAIKAGIVSEDGF